MSLLSNFFISVEKQLKLKIDRFLAKRRGYCTLNGFKVFFGPIPPKNLFNALLTGSYEQHEAGLLKKKLSKDDIVIEAGAGIGYMGLIAARTGMCARYIAFEANPILIPIIHQNMEANGLHFEVRNSLLMDDCGSHPFYIKTAFWGSSLIKPVQGSFEEKSIEALDKNLIMKQIKPTVLVIDIEGGEYNFFINLEIESVKKIILEIHPAVLTDSQLTAIYTQIFSLGFNMDFKDSTKHVVYFYRD